MALVQLCLSRAGGALRPVDVGRHWVSAAWLVHVAEPMFHAAWTWVPRPGSMLRRHSPWSRLLLRPTFFQHFDTVSIDFRYLEARTAVALAEDAAWAIRQRLRPPLRQVPPGAPT